LALIANQLAARERLREYAVRMHTEVTNLEVRAIRASRPSGSGRTWRLRSVRTTPALLGLFSLVTLLAHQHTLRKKLPIRQAWYCKTKLTFSDALALVRPKIGQHECASLAKPHAGNSKLLAHPQKRLLSALRYDL
jgi:hypothetical protein